MNLNSSAEEAVFLNALKQDVDNVLSTHFTEKIAASSMLSPQYGQLWEEMSKLNFAGGKRLRPYMILLSYTSFGGSAYDDVLYVAAGWELLHLCMLIHDDITDQDYTRHGVPNIAGSYNEIYKARQHDETKRSHLALSSALLAGDLALASAYELVSKATLSDADKILALQYMNESVFNVAGGELLDIESTMYTFSEVDPLKVAQLKTASYSFEGPLSVGAALAGASSERLAEIKTLGTIIGCAFQLADDLLDVFGDVNVTGKTGNSDLSEGKRTYLNAGNAKTFR